MLFINKKRGFTLIEAVVYSGLLALFLGMSIVFSNNILGTNNRILERNEQVANLELLNKKLMWLVGQTTAVTAPASGATGSTLTLSGNVSGIYPATFALTNGQITLSINGATAVPITNNRVTVTAFSVDHIRHSISPTLFMEEIRVTVTTQSVALPAVTATRTFSYVIP